MRPAHASSRPSQQHQRFERLWFVGLDRRQLEQLNRQRFDGLS
jgi:hypothetical protein